MRKPTTTTVGDFAATVTPQRAGGATYYRLTLHLGDRQFYAGTFGAPPGQDVMEAAAARLQHHLQLKAYLDRVEPHLDREAGFQ